MSNATNTVLPGIEVVDTATAEKTGLNTKVVRFERHFLLDDSGNTIAEVLADGSVAHYVTPWVVGEPEPAVGRTEWPQAQAQAVHSTVTRKRTALADKQVRAICASIAKAGEADIANYLLHKWFPRKSNELIARAYTAAKANGSRVVIEMLDYEKSQLTKYGSWDALPGKIRRALS